LEIVLFTNDFPPRVGGIQQYLYNLLRGLGDDVVTVYAPAWPGAQEFDGRQSYRVMRDPSADMRPTPGVLRRLTDAVRAVRPEVVVFGAAFPLGLLAGPLTKATGVPCAALTHGVEVGAGAFPGFSLLMRRVADDMLFLTAVSEWSAARLRRVVREGCPTHLLRPGVDLATYHPGADGSRVRSQLRLGDHPVCVCLSRAVRRKGADRLIEAWPAVLAAVPQARLLLVGSGPHLRNLKAMTRKRGLSERIVFTGQVDQALLFEYYAAGDVFAMPCRTRWLGADVEALGLVFLEAAATGLPVVAGVSGGAPETVVDGETGYVVDGRTSAAVAGPVARLLADPALASTMGAAGRRRMESDFGWDMVSSRFRSLLAGALDGAR